MKFSKTILASAAVFGAIPALADTNLRRAADSDRIVDIIVQLHDDSTSTFSSPGNAGAENRSARANEVASSMGLSADAAWGDAIYGFSARNVPEARLKAISSDPKVLSVELDGIITLDPSEVGNSFAGSDRGLQRGGQPDVQRGGRPGGGGGDSTVDQTEPYGIGRVGAPGLTTRLEGRTVCIIDTGIDLDNADLNIASEAFTAPGIRNRRTGHDGNGHGTHVAGTVGAIDNGIDVIGVAPGVTVVAVQVLNKRGSGSWSGIIDGVNWAVGRCDVANMSLGGGVSAALDNAVVGLAQSGVKVVLAAGNESSDASNTSPARANHPNIYTVSATDREDKFASFSNYGSPVDYAAPGVGVDSLKIGGGLQRFSGTSMAAPHVAGILAYGNGICSDSSAIGDRDDNADSIAELC